MKPFVEVNSFTAVDPLSVPSSEIYRLMIGAIVPRPIAFVSSCSAAGIGNLAPFSFFNGVASNPPTLMVSITRKSDGSKKDTLRNIEATRQFVVNVVDEGMVEPMNQCSAEYPYGVDEMEKVGLLGVPSTRVKPLRVERSPVQFECELYNTMEVGDGSAGSATIVVGRIVWVHVRSDLLEQTASHGQRIRIGAADSPDDKSGASLKPLARLGGVSYGKLGEVFDLPRPKV